MRRSMRHLFLIPRVLLVLAAGCGCPNLFQSMCPADASSPDPSMQDPIIGTWQFKVDNPSGQSTIVFKPDMTYTKMDSGSLKFSFEPSGKYLYQDNVLVIREGSGLRELQFSAYVSADGRQLAMIDAFLPAGDHNGLLGTWKSRSVTSMLDSGGNPTSRKVADSTMVFQGDGTMLQTEVVDGQAPSVSQATWAIKDQRTYSLTFGTKDNFISYDVIALDDAALSVFVPPFQRIN